MKKKAKLVVGILAIGMVLSYLGFVSGIGGLAVRMAEAARPTKISWEDAQPRWDVSGYVLYMKEGSEEFEPIVLIQQESCTYDPTAQYPTQCETLIPYDKMTSGRSYIFMLRTAGPQGQMSEDSDWLSMALGEDLPSSSQPNNFSLVIPFNYNINDIMTLEDGVTATKVSNSDNTESFDLTYRPPENSTTPHTGATWSFTGILPVDTATFQTVYAELINMNSYAIIVDMSLRAQKSGLYWGYTLILPAMTYVGYDIPLKDFRLGFNENPSEKKRSENSVIDEFTLSIPPNYLQLQQESSVTEPIRLQSIYFRQ